MKCPVDGTTLALAERAGVEIDYCPECRGVWLDRGELDRILQRAAGPGEREAYGRDDEHGHRLGDHQADHDDERYDGDRSEYGRRGRRRGGAFGALGGLFGGEDD